MTCSQLLYFPSHIRCEGYILIPWTISHPFIPFMDGWQQVRAEIYIGCVLRHTDAVLSYLWALRGSRKRTPGGEQMCPLGESSPLHVPQVATLCTLNMVASQASGGCRSQWGHHDNGTQTVVLMFVSYFFFLFEKGNHSYKSWTSSKSSVRYFFQGFVHFFFLSFSNPKPSLPMHSSHHPIPRNATR